MTILPTVAGLSKAASSARRRIILAAPLLLTNFWGSKTFAQSQVQRLQDVRLALPGPGSAVSLPLELAVTLGLDRSEGINLRLKYVAGGAIAINDIQVSDVEFGVFGLPAAMAANLDDNRLVALAAVEDLGLWVIVVRRDLSPHVKKIADLRGKRIGVHSNSFANKTTSYLLARLVLASHGVGEDNVRFVSAGQDWESQIAALQSDSIDAIMTDEPIASRMISENIGYPIFSAVNPIDARETPGVGFLRASLIGRRDRIQSNPTSAQRVVKVINRVLEWMSTHTPDQIADQIGLKGNDRASFITVSKTYPRQYSRDAKFSSKQLAETDIFFHASETGNELAQNYSVNRMVIDVWAGRKP